MNWWDSSIKMVDPIRHVRWLKIQGSIASGLVFSFNAGCSGGLHAASLVLALGWPKFGLGLPKCAI